MCQLNATSEDFTLKNPRLYYRFLNPCSFISLHHFRFFLGFDD